MGYAVVTTTLTDKVQTATASSYAVIYRYVKMPTGNGWASKSCDLLVRANQTYAPSPLLQVHAIFTFGTGVVTQGTNGKNIYQFDSPVNNVAFDWWYGNNVPKQGYAVIDIPPTIETLTDRYYILRIEYQLPLGSLVGDSLNFSADIGALVFNSNDAAPIPQFNPINVDNNPDTGVPPGNYDWVQWVVVGGLVVAAVGIGAYFLDKAVGFKQALVGNKPLFGGGGRRK